MPVLHFLNVRHGDCSIIQHASGRVTVIDVNNARIESPLQKSVRSVVGEVLARTMGGNFGQKAYPENPIDYMKERNINSVFRFILTHPDMDHLDGISDFFATFTPPNFWDTENTCNKDSDNWDNAPYREEDWKFYKRLRASATDAKRLTYLSGKDPVDYWRQDGLTILAPTRELMNAANDCNEWNDSSYVLLYRAGNFKTILAGDSHDRTWEHIVEEHSNLVRDVDLLLAPHHGRHSDRDFGFLDILQPKLTLFGNAASEHLAYSAWNSRDLPIITNNQAGSVVIDFDSESVPYYVTNKEFAERRMGKLSFYNESVRGWLAGFVRA